VIHGHDNIIATIVILSIQHYFIIVVNCGDPELSSTANDSVPNIEGYDGLPIKGITIRFSCPPGLELIGESSSNSATCTESGEWDPYPSDFVCNGNLQ
jgi:hypothetical protein